ncbi:MAG TPA: copper resistance protein CopC [Actinoplanes sp.]|nr:copper resistance protein CopC [Actinoplanes sp.]
MSRWRDAARLLGIAGTLAVIVLLPASPAAAHAVLVASEPANGAVLAQAPRAVSLRFSEDISARFSSASLLDRAGRPVAGTRIAPGRAGARLLVLELPALPAATYGVAWRVLANDDGHTTSGIVVFTVGGSPRSTAGSALQALDTGSSATAPDVVRRWLGLCLLAGLIGGLAFAAVVLRPAGTRTDEPVRVAIGHARRQVLALAAVAAGLASLVGLADLAVQAGRSGAARPSALLSLLADTRWGQLWVIRESVVIALAVLAAVLRSSSRRADRRDAAQWSYAAVLVAAAVTVEALGGHAASVEAARAAAVAAVAAHALTAFLWLGGVAAVVLVMVRPAGSRDGRDGLLRVVRNRFTVLAVASVGLVIATGLYSAGREVGSVRALVDSSYGRILLLKSGVLLAVAGLGLVNAMRLRGTGPSRRLLAAEVGAAVVLLLAAGALVETPPSREPATVAEPTTGVSRTGTVDDIVVSLSVTPNRPGSNGFTVLAASGRRPPLAPIDGVGIEFSAGAGLLSLQEIEPGRYFGTANLASPGVARATVVIQRGGTALTVPIEWSVQDAVAPAPARDALAPIVNAMAIAVLGILAFAIWRLVSARRPRPAGPFARWRLASARRRRPAGPFARWRLASARRRRPAGLPAAEIEQRIPEDVR